MERFIALAIRLVRIEPDAPTIMPATIIAVLFNARPAAAADTPVMALSIEMTTGMSAPPIGNTTIRPSTPAATNRPIIHHNATPPLPGCACSPITTAAATATASSNRLIGCCALPSPIGRPEMISCNLPNATIDPQNEIDPMIAANNEATTMCTVGDSPCWNAEKPVVSMNSDSAMSATVPPPTPLKNATSCGMAVILVSRAGGTPSTTPTTRPAMISGHWLVCRIMTNVAATAMVMPAAAIRFPRTAVLGPVSPINP
ncbi:Uncharacterised protein [Mycobacterium tuberculosis]|nr:Uncharacterised protein [Mycobacterium tuberculosis]